MSSWFSIGLSIELSPPPLQWLPFLTNYFLDHFAILCLCLLQQQIETKPTSRIGFSNKLSVCAVSTHLAIFDYHLDRNGTAHRQVHRFLTLQFEDQELICLKIETKEYKGNSSFLHTNLPVNFRPLHGLAAGFWHLAEDVLQESHSRIKTIYATGKCSLSFWLRH